jgi:hypothetical protein
MNSSTGQVLPMEQLIAEGEAGDPKASRELVVERIKRDWTEFTIGEEITLKGIEFKVHDVGDQRLVLKFKKK